MYNIIPLILILLSLLIIIIIVVRKFSALASLDIETIKSENEAKVKEQIISNRLKRNFIKWNAKIINVAKFIFEKSNLIFKALNNKLYELKEKYKSSPGLHYGDKDKKVKELFIEVDALINKDMIDEAEKKLIEIIGLDSKNLSAFAALAHLYFENKNYNDAQETFRHILNLIKDQDRDEKAEGSSIQPAEIYFNLALVLQETEKFTEALENIKQALKIEPSNPRYLDSLLELAIINKDKVSALDAYGKLKKVNPDNKKLEEFKKQISEI
ncbi:MAG: tetratricopeptide repeat protein [Patescibacteria group bacterium]